MLSYSLKTSTEDISRHTDDGEHGGGYKIEALLEEAKDEMSNTAVFVLRKYGGEHLNAHRFVMIEQGVKAVMEQAKLLPV